MAMDTSALKSAPIQKYTVEELKKIWERKILNFKKCWTEFEDKNVIPDSMPFRSIVELTQNCNFRCVMCPQSWEEKFKKYNPDYNMSMEQFVNIAEQLLPTSTFVDLRGFGETTMLPHWPDIVSYLENYPFIEWHLVTNLSLPRDDTWDKMIKLGFQLGFSCDGATKETFESIRVRSHFDRIQHNMGVIRDARKRHGFGWIYFISTIQKNNIHELRQIIEMAHKYEVPEVQFKVVQGNRPGETLNEVDPQVIRQNAEAAIDAAVDLGVQVTFNDWLFTKTIDPAKLAKIAARPKGPPSALWQDKSIVDFDLWNKLDLPTIAPKIFDTSRVSVHQRCFKPFSYTYINYKAEVGTCNHMMYPDILVMGDLKKQTLKEIWHGEKYQEFRKQLLFAKPQDPRCQWCFKHRLDD